MRLNHEQASCHYIDGVTHSFIVHREAGKACFFHSAQRFDWVVTDLLLQSESEGGKVVNSERRTWVTIYITLKWDPDHVFLSVRLHDQLMDTQKLTGFLFHCSKSHLFRVFWGFPLCFLAWLHFRGEAKVLSVVFFPTFLTFLEFLFPSFGIFPPFFKKISSLIACSSVCTSTLPFPLLSFSFSSHFPPFLISSCVVFGLCSPHPLWSSSLMDSPSTHRQPHATPA